MFVYKHTETIKYVEKLVFFLRKKNKIYGWITREFLQLKMRHFQICISLPFTFKSEENRIQINDSEPFA